MSNVAKLVLKSSKICQISSTLVCNEHKRAQLITTRLIFECSWSFHGPVTVDIYNHEQSGGTGIQSSIPTAVSGPFPVRLSHSRYPRCSGFPGAFQVTEHLSSWSTPPPTHPIIQKTKRSSAGPAELALVCSRRQNRTVQSALRSPSGLERSWLELPNKQQCLEATCFLSWLERKTFSAASRFGHLFFAIYSYCTVLY